MSQTGPPATPDISPKPPAPSFPDVPWWAVLITAIVFTALGALAGVFGASARAAAAGPPSTTSGFLARFVVDTLSYTPHILLLAGVLMDMFTLEGVWSIPSLVGFVSIFANYVFQYFWKGIDELVTTGKNTLNKGSTPVAPGTPSSTGVVYDNQRGVGRLRGGAALFEGYKACSVQGFEGFATPFAPQTLVVTATVFWYYIFDLIGNRGWINSLGALVGGLVLFGGQTGVILLQNPTGCDEGGSTVTGAIRALFEGATFGGIAYAIVQTYAPTSLPSSTISPFPRKSAGDLSPGPDGKMYDADGYPYVILPNGQAVPDVSDAKARAAFGQLAGSATGSTQTLASSCTASKVACPATA